MARKPNIRGLIRTRSLMKRLPDAVRGEIVVELNVAGRQIAAVMAARTPRQSGRLVAGESFKVFPRTLRLQVGLLRTRRGADPLFYGRIQDLGRKAQVVLVQRRYRKEGTKLTKRYRMKVRGKEGKRFVTGRFPELRRTLNQNLRGIFGRALSTIAGGGDE
ncbi:hypothetical protein KCP91_08175 [Microvirga sp. SRT01]|uniref:Uncharacterized protein n=1 Tax=Sphingomonas longa TaxID=2778730 RepID=A0ABS2D607_9SPHN|nr:MULTISPECIES: hypothetical protein [Alphaproteobacteria]MBM6576347.1 hypothetical protein [Sphingomonas sp. BT552]MBR7709393.1 hypothetical protein [Microvirga sp. SRT01]